MATRRTKKDTTVPRKTHQEAPCGDCCGSGVRLDYDWQEWLRGAGIEGAKCPVCNGTGRAA